jgi:type I protein arginine methyltransferase
VGVSGVRTSQIRVAGRHVRVRTVVGAGDQPSFFPSIGEYQAYDDDVYETFTIPGSRNAAYLRAITDCSAGQIVLDLGTGRDALWAVAAARAGARRVYAVEADPAVAAPARKVVASRGLAHVVTVIEGHSQNVTLPERADVCVSELIGNISSSEGVIGVLEDAARRLCEPHAVWIPYEAETRAAGVNMPSYVGLNGLAVAEEALAYLDRIYQSMGAHSMCGCARPGPSPTR